MVKGWGGGEEAFKKSIPHVQAQMWGEQYYHEQIQGNQE